MKPDYVNNKYTKIYQEANKLIDKFDNDVRTGKGNKEQREKAVLSFKKKYYSKLSYVEKNGIDEILYKANTILSRVL